MPQLDGRDGVKNGDDLFGEEEVGLETRNWQADVRSDVGVTVACVVTSSYVQHPAH